MNLNNYTIQQLVELKEQIDTRLDVKSIDLNAELVAQFKLTRLIMNEALEDEDTKTNHLTGLINAATLLLKQIADSQTKLYTASNVQIIERVLAEQLLTLPSAQREKFLADYEEALCKD